MKELSECPYCHRRSYLCGSNPCIDRDRDYDGIDDADEPLGIGPTHTAEHLLFPVEEKGFAVVAPPRLPFFWRQAATRKEKGFTFTSEFKLPIFVHVKGWMIRRMIKTIKSYGGVWRWTADELKELAKDVVY